MKGLMVWLFLVGCAAAAFQDVLDVVSDDLVQDFVSGMEDIPALKDVLQLEHAEEAEQLDHDIKKELEKTLKDVLREVTDKIRLLVEQGKKVSKDLVEKAKDIATKLKEVGINNREAVEKLRNRIRDWMKNFQERLGIGKRSLSDVVSNLVSELDLKNLLQKLKNKIVEKVNPQAIVKYIKGIFGEFSTVGRILIQTIKTQGVQSLKNLVSMLLSGVTEDNRVERSTSQIGIFSCVLLQHISENADVDIIRGLITVNMQDEWKNRLLNALDIGIPTLRSLLTRHCLHGPISDAWNKVKNFFQGVGEQIKEKFSVFGDWIQNVAKSGWSKTKDKASQLKEIAQTVIANGKSLTSKAATQALEFFNEHKETIGKVLWKQLKSVAVGVIISSIVG